MSSTLCRHILNVILYYTCFLQRPEKKNRMCTIHYSPLYLLQTGSLTEPKAFYLSSLAAQRHLATLLSPVAPVLNIGVEVLHRALLGIQTHISCVHSQPSYPQSRLSSSYSTFLLAFECALSYEVRYGIFPLEHHDSLNKFPAFGHLGFCILGLGMLILCQ